jgi:hypothetical protein
MDHTPAAAFHGATTLTRRTSNVTRSHRLTRLETVSTGVQTHIHESDVGKQHLAGPPSPTRSSKDAHWTRTYARAFPTFNFYLHDLDREVLVKLRHYITALQGHIEPFFSCNVTHLILPCEESEYIARYEPQVSDSMVIYDVEDKAKLLLRWHVKKWRLFVMRINGD